MTLLEGLARRRLLVVTGKGGVGKSTVAATLGRLLADVGRRVLLLEVDPRESVYQLLGLPPSGGEIVEAEPRLLLQNLRPRSVLDEVVREQVHLEFLTRRVLSSPVYHHFTEAAPGLKEMAVLGHAYRVASGVAEGAPEVDLVLLDAPASGHGVSLVAAPLLVSEVIREGPFGQMAAELATFVADAERCGIVLTTLAEEMPVQETLELIRSVETTLDRRPEIVVVNGLYPPVEAAGEGDLRELGRRRRAVNERELRRLAEAWSGPRAELPLLPVDRGPALVDALEERLDEQLARQGGL